MTTSVLTRQGWRGLSVSLIRRIQRSADVRGRAAACYGHTKRFEWYPEKAAANLAKHGVSFVWLFIQNICRF